VGLDLSKTLLKQARAGDPELIAAEGDMRHLPFADEAFQMVANFFTSFGYFAEPEDDEKVLGEIRRVLQARGCFMLDFLNAERVRASLIDRDERLLNGRLVVQERRLEEEGRIVVKKIQIHGSDNDDSVSTFFERVRLYSPDELQIILRRSGLEPESTFGDYSGAPASPDCPRYILTGHAV
jgi:SAM-dependent methyltransferase